MVIRIPEAGLQVESSAKAMAALPTQAFAITLSDSVIEDLIECVQNGQDIKLSLGNIPSIIYGSSVHNIPQMSDTSSYDLFLSDPTESSRKTNKLPNPTMSLFRKPDLNKVWLGRTADLSSKEGKRTPLHKTNSTAAGKESQVYDADVAALKNSFAQAEAEKWENSTRVIEGAQPNAKRGNLKVGKKLPASRGSYTVSSLPASPALSGITSPSHLPASQQAAEKAKKARSPIIHELAFKEQTHDNLWQKYPGDSQDEFKTALEKVADMDKDTQNYVLKKMYWKELDVWNHEYASDEERQQAIDNAVKQYDKMRLTASEPEWQKLLPREERGKGKCLSKMQANIMKGPVQAPAPKIKVQKAEESSGDSGSSKDDGAEKKKAAKGGDSSVRSTSQSAPKVKKAPKEPAPEKRWLSNKKAATPKVSPTKPSPKLGNEKSGKFKSKEFITDSDSSDDESAPLASSVTQSKVVKKPVERVAKEQPPPQPKPKAQRVVEEPIKSQITAKPPVKRSREDDDSSSSSGTPLSKRIRVPKEIKAAPVQSLKHRASDASQNSRGTSSGVSFTKSKNTSPIKSSPLASSPPTNASDMDPSEDNIRVSKKRKADHDSDSSATKRQHLSQDVLNKAVKFRVYYEKYEALHKEMVLLEHPPVARVADLKDMRERLKRMKTEIYQEVQPVR